ncbi:amidohydrolase family protein [Amycolatopsis ultiminotia]|uniref:Amidohydrolase family protein n=1 Tax=Amycolatopsis ultiminotia TaxID=543629 RepID=A0ABP6YKD4_9PSEU
MGSGTELRNARFLGGDDRFDLRVEGGRITAITPAGAVSRTGGETVDLDGRILTPGLWDEHVHFTQWTTQRSRFDLTGTAGVADVFERVRAVLRRGEHSAGSIVTGYGFRDGSWPAPPTLRALDEVTGPVPVVLISADLHCAWLNSAAAARLGAQPDPSGIVREGEWFALGPELAAASPPTTAMFRDSAEAAARRGVVGVVEFENTDNLGQWPERVAAGVDSLRVEASVWPHRLDGAIAGGLRTGAVIEPRGLVTMGRLKVVVDGSLNTRTALCWDPYPGREGHGAHACGMSSVPPGELRVLLEQAHRHGIAAAVHAIGDRANSEVIDIFEELGIAGTIEHAQLVRADDFSRFKRLGLVASVQPEHAMDDRDIADRHWSGRTDRAFAYGSLHAAGATLRFGSDAPVAPLDPWFAIAAATTRTRDDRAPWHPEQRVPLDLALAASMRGRTRPVAGDLADLTILDDDPGTATSERLRNMPVAGTLLGGRWTWRGL